MIDPIEFLIFNEAVSLLNFSIFDVKNKANDYDIKNSIMMQKALGPSETLKLDSAHAHTLKPGNYVVRRSFDLSMGLWVYEDK